jgi:phosphoenolpyruvate phosphomutase
MAADIFHHGHINILIKAKKYGNVIVGLMTDSGIKSYKGKKPIISFKNRLKILNHIDLVSYVLPLPGLKYVNFAKKFKFDFFAHGSDWKKNVQSDQRKKLKKIMASWGGKIIDIPYTANISSSKIKKLFK